MAKDTDLPTLSSLIAFDATIRHGSMTAAANELDITQPLVSQRIRALEEIIGGVLIDRAKKPLAATNVGLKFHKDIESSLVHINRAISHAKNDIRQTKTKVSICAYFGFAFHWLIPRMQRLQSAFPDYLFEIQPTNSLSDMMASHADILFHYSGVMGKYRFEKMLIPEEVFPVCSPDFAKRYELDENEPLTDLRNLPLLHKDKDDPRWFNWLTWSEVLGIKPPSLPVMFCYNNYPLVVESAVNSHGLCLGWKGLIDPFIKDGKLIALGPRVKCHTRGYMVCSDYESTVAVGRVIDWFMSEA